MKYFLMICAGFIMVNTLNAQDSASSSKMNYPKTKTVNQVDTYFGIDVKDPYRWLEIDTAANVAQWVKEQNKVTQSYLNSIPYKDKVKARFQELFNFVKMSAPFKIGNKYIYSKNDGLQNQSVYFIQEGKTGTPQVLLDPNMMSKEGTMALELSGSSKDQRYISYIKSSAGSDWASIHTIDLTTLKDIPDVTEWVKFSGASWYKNGYFYSRFPEPKPGMELSDANQFHAVYYHEIGTPQSSDSLIFDNKKEPLITYSAGVTEDEKYLLVYPATGTDGFECWYKDLTIPKSEFKCLFSGFKNKSSVIDNIGSDLLVLTDIDAPNYQLVRVNPNMPEKENWTKIIKEDSNLLESVTTGGGKLFATYLKNATSFILQLDYDGSNPIEIKLQGVGSAGIGGSKKNENEVFYSYSSFISPVTIYSYNVATGKSIEFFKTDLKFNQNDFIEKQVFYTGKDDTKVSMFLVHKKGITLDGNNPCYLYSYGGFSVPLTPGFSASRIMLLENGGVFAMPNIRGGSEYGEEWHKAGMKQYKQNVFDDFISAAEYLIAEGYTSSKKLGIAGGSNGGLLVGACMTQRPDLYAVALPAVGVMDMLRYHKFTIGWAWVPEYGSSDEPKMFRYLHRYSPLHNLKPRTCYPATLITTADHDDRVVPAHSFKFAATLQACQSCNNPALIRIESNAGHGAGKPTKKIIEEQADYWSFFFQNTGTKVIY